MTTPFSTSITNPVNTKEYEISNALYIKPQKGGNRGNLENPKSEISTQFSDTIDDTLFDHLIKQHEYVPPSNTKNKTRRKTTKKPKTRRPIRKLKMRKSKKIIH